MMMIIVVQIQGYCSNSLEINEVTKQSKVFFYCHVTRDEDDYKNNFVSQLYSNWSDEKIDEWVSSW